MEEEDEEEEDNEEEDTSTVEPNSAGGGGVTERSNTSGDGKSSQILYVITSSPGKPERSMPGQWLGPGRTAGHSTSMCLIPCCFFLLEFPFNSDLQHAKTIILRNMCRITGYG